MVLVAYKLMNPIVLAGPIVMGMHFLHAGSKCATLPGTEESMTTTIEFITALFYEVDEQLRAIPKHPEARLWPSSGLVSAAPRAHPALSSLRDPSRLDEGLLGLADRAGCH